MATPIPPNDARLSLAEILAATAGRISGPVADEAVEIVGVSTDTRALRRGELFVALSGERFDGHDHLAAAAAAGAALALVERDVAAPPLTTVRVADTLAALRALAALHLSRWRASRPDHKVVAITGSAGKTTTRQAIEALLRAACGRDAVHAAAGNLNNLVGVPMTIFGLTGRHRYAVLELGTNRPGEIALLARLARPDVAVLTLIALAHGEGLGDVEAIAREKRALFDALETGWAVGNVDDARVSAALCRCARPLGYGHEPGAEYHIADRRIVDADRARLVLERPSGPLELELRLVGRAGALACAAAVAVVETLIGRPLSSEVVAGGMAAIEPSGRLRPRHAASGLCVLDDSYNANPASCRASIEAAGEIAAAMNRRLLLVLGEMRELGAAAGVAHDELGELAARSGAALLVAVGGVARRTADHAAALGMRARFCETAAEAADVAAAEARADDLVLVKGSRGVGTEAVVDALLRAHDGARAQAGAAP